MLTQHPKRLHIVIVLPTYNEAENVDELFRRLFPVVEHERNYQFSILVVDDNSPDGTATKVRSYMKTHPNIHLLTGEKQGLGTAYVRGMKYATGKLGADILFEMDADLSHDPALIPSFLRELERGADLVIGSRYIKGGSIPNNWGINRKIFSVFGNMTVRFGLMIPRIHEWSSGYRAIRSGAFETISKGLEKYTGYIFQIASMHRVVQRGYVVSEVPLNFVDRKYGKSKIIPTEYIPDIIQYIVFNSSFIKFFTTGLFGFVVDFTVAYLLIHGFDLFKPTANAISAEAAIINNFIINNFWSFKHKRIQGSGRIFVRKFLQFNSIAVGSIVIQFFGMYLALSLYGDRILAIGEVHVQSWIFYKICIIAFLLIPYSYFMYNRFIWKE